MALSNPVARGAAGRLFSGAAARVLEHSGRPAQTTRSDPHLISRLARASGLVLSGLIALALTAAPIRAQPEPPLSLRYGVYWAGLQIATLALDHRVDSDQYHSELLISTVGLVEELAHYRSKSLAIGERDPDDGLNPLSFSSEYSSRKKDRRSVVRFDRDSGDVVGLEITKRGKPDRSKVPEGLRKNVTDPLTAFFQLRDHVASAQDGEPFTAAVFDGRRRYDLAARVADHDRVWVAGRKRKVVEVKITLTLLAGSDLDDVVEVDDRKLELKLLLSDDQRLLPLRLQLLDTVPAASIELLEDCSGEAGCQLAAR
jgi:hypothetical protein